MGQAVSKQARCAAISSSAASSSWRYKGNDILRSGGGSIPRSTTIASFSSSSGGGSSGSSSSSSPPPPKIQSTAANPGNFLRGEGLVQDERDLAQERYWKERHNVGGGGDGKDDNSKSSTSASSKQQSHELPPDLLQFLKDVGPLKQTLDKEQTSPRILKDEKEKEQDKMSRPLKRERMTMPLMGNDDTFTAVRNTNFARTSISSSSPKPPFGITGLQLYDLLVMNQKQQQQKQSTGSNPTEVVDTFYNKHFGGRGAVTGPGDDDSDKTTTATTTPPTETKNTEDDEWSAQEIQDHKQLLQQTMSVIDLPILVQDADGNYLGISPDQQPGSEVTNIRYVSPDKVQLVVADWINQQEAYHAYRAKVMQERRHRNPVMRKRTTGSTTSTTTHK